MIDSCCLKQDLDLVVRAPAAKSNSHLLGRFRQAGTYTKSSVHQIQLKQPRPCAEDLYSRAYCKDLIKSFLTIAGKFRHESNSSVRFSFM